VFQIPHAYLSFAPLFTFSLAVGKIAMGAYRAKIPTLRKAQRLMTKPVVCNKYEGGTREEKNGSAEKRPP
jgi:hypothetical protein